MRETYRRAHENERNLPGVAQFRSDTDGALREIYLPLFKAAVRKAGIWAIMSSYNRVNGVYSSENRTTLHDILRDEWGFDGLVMSDWFGTRSTAPSVNAGQDLEMPGPAVWRGDKLLEAVRRHRTFAPARPLL